MWNLVVENGASQCHGHSRESSPGKNHREEYPKVGHQGDGSEKSTATQKADNHQATRSLKGMFLAADYKVGHHNTHGKSHLEYRIEPGPALIGLSGQ